MGEHSISIDVSIGDHSWCLTAVYGPQADEDKVAFLDELREIRATVTSPWMIAGDFNLILDASDKNNANIHCRNMGRFRRFVNEHELKDIHLHGHNYTWNNERDRPTLVKLDRVLVTVDWEATFQNCFMQALPTTLSDHCPLLLSTNIDSSGKRRFHFEKFWTKMPGFSEAVEKG